MKGVVFTEFVEMVEEMFSVDLADQILEESNLPSGGAYTSLGTYDHQEMLTLVTHLSEATGIPVQDLIHAFGHHLLTRFAALFPTMFSGVDGTFSFLTRIEDYIHVEVRKLYPDAELPHFVYEWPSEGEMIMTYSSKRPFALLAGGLIAGAIEHYGEAIDVQMEDLAEGASTSARFVLRRRNG